MAVKIKLTEPVEMADGKTKVSSIKMREPKTRDILNLDLVKSDELKEITLVSRLTDVPIDSLQNLGLKNYKRLQAGLEYLQADGDIDPNEYLSDCLS